MTVPTFVTFIEPLLRYLARHPDGVAVAATYEALADAVKLSPAERDEMLPSGAQAVYKNRIGWAHDRLKRAGLSASPRRGVWQLTPAGASLVAERQRLAPEQIARIASVERSSRIRDKPSDEADDVDAGVELTAANAAPVPVQSASPEERIDAALAEVRESVARDLLESIGRAPPQFFEHLVLELLHAMGYGANRSAIQRVGGSGDGGIDGIISLDRLGLEKVYIQAKRWKNAVGSPEIQGFMGALQLQGASKGVFLTTSSFTKDAKQAAERARGSIVLVDGERLTALMMDHGVAVSHRELRVPKVDHDYFEDA